MPQPLDYRNAKSSARTRGPVEPAVPGVRPVIPMQFDRLLTETDDHAAAQAIETQLRKANIEFHRVDDGARAQRKLEIYVASKHFEDAAQIAATIFVRRAKIKKFPRPETPYTGPETGGWIDLTPMP